MFIEEEIKLDFRDVLIRPKRSNLKSRSDVNITRTFSFKHAKDITEKIGCPTDSLEAMVRCLKDEKSAQDIVNTHTQYIVSFYVKKNIMSEALNCPLTQ